MRDDLENFVNANRDAFDDKEPPAGVWNSILTSLPRQKVSWYDSVVLWRAAAMIFLALSIYLLIPRAAGLKGGSVAVKEFNDVEAFYTGQISQKVALIEQISGASDGSELTHDFQQLEAMYNVLKEEWKARPSKKVKDALVLNLLVRINLLNQQLHRLEAEESEDEEETKKSET